METFSGPLVVVRGIHRSPVNSAHKSQRCGALVLSLICAWTNSCVNNRDAGDLRRHSAHYDVIVMTTLTRGHIWRDILCAQLFLLLMILMPNAKIINACNLHLIAIKYMPNLLARCTSYERHNKRDHQKPVVWYRTSVLNAIDSKDTPSMMALVGYRAVIHCIIDAYNKYHWN